MPMNGGRGARAATPSCRSRKTGRAPDRRRWRRQAARRVSSASGFCVGWALRPASSFSRSGPGADRQEPVGADLAILVAGLERLVIERIGLGVGASRRPDHRLVGVGEAAAAEIRHRIGLAPDDVVEDPEAEILEDRADAEYVVIGADDDHASRRASSPAGRRRASARVNASYSAKSANLSQSSSTASTRLWSGRESAPSSCRL